MFCFELSADLPTYSSVDSKGVPFDHKLIRLLNRTNGFFIEVGASNGVEQSNTKLLEDIYGWTGILVEPAPSVFESLCRNRLHSKCFQCALGSNGENGTYVMGDFDGALMASIRGIRRSKDPIPHDTCTVLVRSLQSILDEVNVQYVDFFSLDVEGYELNVLKGVDFKKTKFGYMLIEIYRDQYDSIISLLDSNGYEMIGCFSSYNCTDNQDWDGTHDDYLFAPKNSHSPHPQ